MSYTVFHVIRNLSKHAAELDDKLFGAPVQKSQVDWPLLDPEKYLKDLKAEKDLLLSRLDDLTYVMRENNVRCSFKITSFDEETAEEHCYHKFTQRSFHYIELISDQLKDQTPKNLNVSKARRQLKVAVAALEDIDASIIRFTKYAKEIKAKE